MKQNPASDDTGPFVVPSLTFSHGLGIKMQIAFDRQTHGAADLFQLFE
jgi:hypothetical protein